MLEFGALFKLHDKSTYEDGTLKHETVNMLQNVLEMQEKYISQIVTPASNMLMLHSDTSLNASTVLQYLSNGYSHVFVYNNDEKERLDTIQDDYEILGVLDLKVVSVFAVDMTESHCHVRIVAAWFGEQRV